MALNTWCKTIILPVFFACALAFPAPSPAAENLRMRDGISYVHDLDQGFPIIADKMTDVELSTTHPSLLFFGAPGDLNTNRQARRIVEIYKKYKGDGVKFIVIDVDHPINDDAKKLIKAYYQNYIPGQLIFDRSGKQKWSRSGETEISVISGQLDKLID